jgi:hypothetical protein
MNRATTFFPVPDSPCRKTVVSVGPPAAPSPVRDAAAIAQHEFERIVMHDVLHDRGHARQQATNVQHVRNRAQQLGRHIDDRPL